MQIYILRHGQAEPKIITDEARNLTAKGRDDVAETTRFSLTELKTVQEIWVSPLVRAQQTASIVSDMLLKQGSHFLTKTTDLIVPEADPYVLLDALQTSHVNSILLVSHQPLVAQVIELLCSEDEGFYAVNTSSLACVDCEVTAKKMGKLRWLRHTHE